jgi:hypothetical protein
MQAPGVLVLVQPRTPGPVGALLPRYLAYRTREHVHGSEPWRFVTARWRTPTSRSCAAGCEAANAASASYSRPRPSTTQHVLAACIVLFWTHDRTAPPTAVDSGLLHTAVLQCAARQAAHLLP